MRELYNWLSYRPTVTAAIVQAIVAVAVAYGLTLPAEVESAIYVLLLAVGVKTTIGKTSSNKALAENTGVAEASIPDAVEAGVLAMGPSYDA